LADITRRGFLGGTIVLAASLKGGYAFARGKGADIVDVSGNNADKMVAAALAGLGGIKEFVGRGDYVVIKANGGFANPAKWATTTNPEVLTAIAKACLAAKAKQVIVVEHSLSKGRNPLERCGINAAMKAIKVPVKELNESALHYRKVKIKRGVELKETEVAKAVLSADVLINVPVAKQHEDTGISFGTKNVMGLIRHRRPFHTTLNIHQAVADLAHAIKPDLTIIDATRVLLSNGPAGPGKTQALGRIVAGRNVISTDVYGLRLAQFGGRKMSPADAPHLAKAGKAGLGELNLSKLSLKKLSA
jgi:uncharacterized protein (DUF362 family)